MSIHCFIHMHLFKDEWINAWNCKTLKKNNKMSQNGKIIDWKEDGKGMMSDWCCLLDNLIVQQYFNENWNWTFYWWILYIGTHAPLIPLIDTLKEYFYCRVCIGTMFIIHKFLKCKKGYILSKTKTSVHFNYTVLNFFFKIECTW